LQIRLQKIVNRRPGLASPTVTFEIGDGQAAEFICYPPAYQQAAYRWIACVLGKQDQWIELESLTESPRDGVQRAKSSARRDRLHPLSGCRNAQPGVAWFREEMSQERTTSDRRSTPAAESKGSSWVKLIPVAVTLLVGAGAILLGAQQGPRGITHIMLLSLVLGESAVALLVARRHPRAALLGVLVTYVLVDNEATTLLPVLLVLYTVARSKDRWTAGVAAAVTAFALVVTPAIHGATASLLLQTFLPLLAAGLAVAIGINRRADQSAPATSA
jgi:hypothetical protein